MNAIVFQRSLSHGFVRLAVTAGAQRPPTARLRPVIGLLRAKPAQANSPARLLLALLW